MSHGLLLEPIRSRAPIMQDDDSWHHDQGTCNQIVFNIWSKLSSPDILPASYNALFDDHQAACLRLPPCSYRTIQRPRWTPRRDGRDGRRILYVRFVFVSLPPQGNHFPSIVVSTRDTERQHSGGFPSWPGEHPFWNTSRRTATEEQPRVHKNDKTTRRSCRRTQAPNPEEQQHDKVR